MPASTRKAARNCAVATEAARTYRAQLIVKTTSGQEPGPGDIIWELEFAKPENDPAGDICANRSERESHGGGHIEMPMQRYKPEQIVTILRQIEVAVANGKSTPQACKEAAITVQTYYRWRNVKGGVKLDHQGGAKPDHYGNGEGFVLLDLRGWLEWRPAPPLGGAFRPEWKAPLQIVATCRQGKSGTTFGGQASWGASACFP